MVIWLLENHVRDGCLDLFKIFICYLVYFLSRRSIGDMLSTSKIVVRFADILHSADSTLWDCTRLYFVGLHCVCCYMLLGLLSEPKVYLKQPCYL